MTTEQTEPAEQTPDPSLTPLMRQYTEIKRRNPETVLLYRMGDFFELFNEDAKIASQVLGLTLTSRNHGGKDATPLAGFPHHALDRYANRLVKAGYKIAICEQTEDPKLAKGIVKRDVVEVITAGTATEDNFIDEKSNNYIVAIVTVETVTGLGICDLSTGEFQVEEIPHNRVEEELARLDPSEILTAQGDANPLIDRMKSESRSIVVSRFDEWKFGFENASDALLQHFQIASLQALGLDGYTAGIRASGALLTYLKEQKKNDLRHITTLSPRTLGNFAQLDPASIRNLELLRPMMADDAGTTLLSVLDKTGTAMGARLLKRWITHPLTSISAIEERLDCVTWLKSDVFARRETELFLRRIADIERLIGRITFERANARDMVGMKQSLTIFPRLVKTLAAAPGTLIHSILTSLANFESIVDSIEKTIVDEPPLSVKDGCIIKRGISAELDETVDGATNGKQWIASLQQQERERTGISSLKVGYTKVFGYYIEISNANSTAVPLDYIRKQTLVNCERFITPALKDMEAKILGAEERRGTLEYEIFAALRRQIALECPRIQKAAEGIAALDVLVCLAACAAEYNYIRPQLNDGTEMIVREGRHPVVERMTGSEQFVPNDTRLSSDDAQILLITGPNMAGKSTYLRQNSLIALMAQMGSFVPATSAQIGIVDRFYTRVGASDRLARGQSTFLVEMIEVANILNNATDRSLVLLDEVGRGTSTFDGISIAWAVAEFLHETPGRHARTFFATHYHELTELALLFPRIHNLHIKVKEWNDKIIFLRKIDEGSCDHSYGIQVARLAGVPKPVIIRAKEILANLESMELTPDQKPILARHGRAEKVKEAVQIDMFYGQAPAAVTIVKADPVMEQVASHLSAIDVNNLTPIQALQELAKMKDMIKKSV